MAIPVQGGCAPLFDRLATPDPWEPAEKVPRRVLDGEELRWSVHRELQDLLNTRCTLRAAELEARRPTTLEYGLADLTGLRPADPGDRREVGARIEAAIRAYEPRLQDPRATVEPVQGRPRELRVHVEGMLALHQHPQAVGFDLFVGGHAGEAP